MTIHYAPDMSDDSRTACNKLVGSILPSDSPLRV